MSMHRIELVNMIRIVCLSVVSESLARSFPLSKSASDPANCLLFMKPAHHFQTLLSLLHTSFSPSHCSGRSIRARIERALSNETLTQADNTVAAQMQEMELVRQKVYELERNQMQIKQRYAVALMA